MTLAHNLSNSAALEAGRKAAIAHAKALGRAEGEGMNSLPSLGIFCCEQAQMGILSHSTKDTTDATAMYNAYLTECSKKSEHTDGGKAANASKLGNFIKLGIMPQPIDGVAVLQDAVLTHQDMRKRGIKVKAAYLAYETVCKAQLASPHARLTTAELRSLMEKDTADRTAKDHLKAAAKALEKALTMPQDMSPDEARHAQDALASACSALNMLENREARAAKMAELAALQAELGLAA